MLSSTSSFIRLRTSIARTVLLGLCSLMITGCATSPYSNAPYFDTPYAWEQDPAWAHRFQQNLTYPSEDYH